MRKHTRLQTMAAALWLAIALTSCRSVGALTPREEEGLVAYYPLDEGSGDLARDHCAGHPDFERLAVAGTATKSRQHPAGPGRRTGGHQTSAAKTDTHSVVDAHRFQETVMTWRIADPAHLLAAMRVSLVQGGQFLTSRIAPNGPILQQPNLSYVHKTSWGMYAAGVEHDTIARLLDWAQHEALQENGDFFFPHEAPEYKDFQRVYRPLNFCRIAAWIDHPVVRRPGVLQRILQYQHQPSGGVFHHIGDDPRKVEEPATIGTLNTTFFGHLMIALDERELAIAAGEWVRRWVDANRDHMANGLLYTQMTPAGDLVTEVGPGERISKVVDTQSPKQEFWNEGTAMAYLAVLYDVMRTQWGHSEERARPYLEAALALLDFEATMPLDTYLWPSKCKVGWGAGELLRVLVEHGLGNEETIEKAYRVAERVAMFTFMDNQLAGGGWPQMHYPLSEQIPEMALSYKPLKDIVGVPSREIQGSQTIFLSGEEITGEFLGEMKAIEQGVAAWLRETEASE